MTSEARETRRAAAIYVGTTLLTLGVLGRALAGLQDAFEGLNAHWNVEPPEVVQRFFDAFATIRYAGVGLIVLGAAIAASLLPLALAPESAATLRWFRRGTWQVIVFAVALVTSIAVTYQALDALMRDRPTLGLTSLARVADVVLALVVLARLHDAVRVAIAIVRRAT